MANAKLGFCSGSVATHGYACITTGCWSWLTNAIDLLNTFITYNELNWSMDQIIPNIQVDQVPKLF